jgi:hypothetical protein
MELLAGLCHMMDMDLASYYRHQAGNARQLAGVYEKQHQTKAALERVAQEYDGLADQFEELCGRDPQKRYALAAYIDAWRDGRWWFRQAFPAFEDAPLDYPIEVSRDTARARVERGRRTEVETPHQTSQQLANSSGSGFA